MNSAIGNIYRSQIIQESKTWDEQFGKKYTGLVGRRYSKQYPNGRGLIDVDELDKPILEEMPPFYYISRDTDWDAHHEDEWEEYKWFPKVSGWACSIVEAAPYDDLPGSDLRFARWLPSIVQPYMKYLKKSRIFREHWSTYRADTQGDFLNNNSKNYVADIRDIQTDPDDSDLDTGGTGRHATFHESPPRSGRSARRWLLSEITNPLRLSEAGQDILLWKQGQFIYNMFHHKGHNTPHELFQNIVGHFYKLIKTDLPDRYKDISMGELDDVDGHFDVFCQVFEYRLHLNLKAMEEQRWSEMRYGNQPEIITPGYKSKNGDGAIGEHDYGYFTEPERFLKDHQDDKNSHVATPWDHI